MNIVFATNNKHKLEEIREAIGTKHAIISLAESGISEDIPETGDTLEENALQKANFIYSRYGLNCFADDTGLEVFSLDGRPGVYSARYAGEHCSFEDNVNKLLKEMHGKTNREARFRTVIALIIDGQARYFEGLIDGIITDNAKGKQGFGYDPVFKPETSDKTFAEMKTAEKNIISHRARAVKKLVAFLDELK